MFDLITFKKTYLTAVTNGRVGDPADAPSSDRTLGKGI